MKPVSDNITDSIFDLKAFNMALEQRVRSATLFSEIRILLWLLLALISFNTLSFEIPYLLEKHPAMVQVYSYIAPVSIPVYPFVLLYLSFIAPSMPRRSIGRYGKCVVDVINVCTSLMLRRFVPYDIHCLSALVCFTSNLQCYCHLLRFTWDVNIVDFLLGVMMQIVVYEKGGSSMYSSLVVLEVCGAIIFFKWLWYHAPNTSLETTEEELEKLHSQV